LSARIWQHRHVVVPGFTSKYGVKTLVWFEAHASRESALLRERQMKKWNRRWKLQLIERANPAWRDLAVDLGIAE
jgi:putative endonuclease